MKNTIKTQINKNDRIAYRNYLNKVDENSDALQDLNETIRTAL